MKTALKMLVAMSILVASGSEALAHRGRDGCSPHRFRRSPQQVIQEHIAAIEAGDWDKAACDYSEDAVVQTDFGTFRGRNEIRQSKQAFLDSFGALPQVTRLTSEGPVVFLTFTLTAPGASIPDGVDTYVVVFGQIVSQTAHGVIVFGP